MRFYPTPRLVFLGSIGVLIALAGAWVPGLEVFILLYNFALLLFVVIGRIAGPNPKDLQLKRQMDGALSVRARNQVVVTLTNLSNRKVSGIMRDECPTTFKSSSREGSFSLKPGQFSKLEYVAIPQVRGTETFLGTWIQLNDPFGLTVSMHVLGRDDVVDVYPNLLAVQEFDLLNRRGRLSSLGIRRTRYRGVGTEFESLRNYQSGDSFRLIDWKSSARRGDLVVKEFEVERNQPVFVVIDIGRGMLAEANGVTKLDHVLDAALLFMHAVEVAGDQLGLMVYADRLIHFIPPKRGRGQISLILKTIHDIVAQPLESNHRAAFHTLAARWKRRALMVVFTEVESPEEASPLLAALEQQRHRHLWFIARVKDPGLKAKVASELARPEDYYKRAAAFWYDEKRDRAAQMIHARYPDHVDAEPQDLAAALVNHYIDAKLRMAI